MKSKWRIGIGAFALLGTLTACATEDVGSAASADSETCLDEAPADGPKAGTVVRDSLKGESLTFATWGGGYTDAQVETYVKPFEACSGATVKVDVPISWPKLKAMIDSDNVLWDITYGLSSEALEECPECMLEVDTTKVDLSDIFESSFDSLTDEQGVLRGLPATWEVQFFSYNTKNFKDNPPTGPADFFDPQKFPGKRLLQGDPAYPDFTAWSMAALVAGFSFEEISADFPFDEAEAVMERIRKDITYTPTSADQQQQLEQGRVAMSTAFSGRVYNAALNSDIKFLPIPGKAVVAVGPIQIPKGAKNEDAAWALMNFIAGPKPQAALAESQIYAPTNKTAQPTIPEAMKPYFQPGDVLETYIQPYSPRFGGDDFQAKMIKRHSDFMARG